MSNLEVAQQCGDAGLEVVADVADPFDGLVVGVSDIRVRVGLPWSVKIFGVAVSAECNAQSVDAGLIITRPPLTLKRN